MPSVAPGPGAVQLNRKILDGGFLCPAHIHLLLHSNEHCLDRWSYTWETGNWECVSGDSAWLGLAGPLHIS